MKRKYISETMNNIDLKYVDEAIAYTGDAKKAVRHTRWMKWRTIAACFALVAVFGIGIFGNGKQIVTLDNGDTINFVKTYSALGQSDIAIYAETRTLTESEIKMLFNDLPVAAYAHFSEEDNRMLGLEGNVDGMKLVVSVPNVPLVDTVITGIEKASNVDGVPVNAGYFESGENAIYYAYFKVGESSVYIEHAGTKDKREMVKNEISVMIQKLIALKEINLNQIVK